MQKLTEMEKKREREKNRQKYQITYVVTFSFSHINHINQQRETNK